ncbi:IclR family transcriptional regulator domain-containing protein [Novosphingobium humi]|uniref:IclR family transcriptional regulator C-terminal domain-containing protein n=1 Tax=Novosphingobium humi TaxID=2282397 RepID=A0ABY7U489_9SPHN|nr:IclR family transcriptional regulator C-terminal domain-containing protein [Novosphingobium humi]WCT79149.1 IclR family transcriptional regulator C-terminal domain-containing protein [Novosphingobium humi]
MRTRNGRFQLGPTLADLGGKVDGDTILLDAVQPHLEELAGEFREALHCVVRVGNEAMNSTIALPDRSLLINQDVGRPFPLHCTAGGKVFLAAMGETQRRSFTDNLELTQFTDNTIVTHERLVEELNRVAELGYAVDNGEWEDGLRSVAVPLHNASGKVIAAIALSAPASRLDDERVVQVARRLNETVQNIERHMFSQSKTFGDRARPLGNYPHLKRVDNFIFISGTSARRADNTFAGVEVNEDGTFEIDFREQTRYVLNSISEMLSDFGSSITDIVDLQAYLTDMSAYAIYNEVYATFFPPDGPTRTTVGVNELMHPHQGIMVRAVAYHPQ